MTPITTKGVEQQARQTILNQDNSSLPSDPGSQNTVTLLHAQPLATQGECSGQSLFERSIDVIEHDQSIIGCHYPEKHQSTPELQVIKGSVEQSVTSVAKSSREQFGGKGMFLQTMESMNLPVPPFHPVNIHLFESIEQQRFPASLIQASIPEWPDLPKSISLQDVTDRIGQFRPFEKTTRDEWLTGLARFIVSNDFYNTIRDSAAAAAIKSAYEQLVDKCPDQPLIVRSSGIHEDNYGDAQAGKFDSHVKGSEPILRTCLKVLASGYQPTACKSGRPQPMALVLQACIPCAFGGVVLSHSSLQDDRIKVEYAPGQPRTTVAGIGELTPHRYQLNRTGESEQTLWQQGVIPAIYKLQNDGDGVYSEQKIPYQSTGVQSEVLSPTIQAELLNTVCKLEDRLLCPVDVEFGVGHNGKFHLLQVRPITQLTGGSSYTDAMPLDPLIDGQLVSEGCCCGEPLYMKGKASANALPKGVILYADHGDDWMLEPDVLKRVGGFVLAMGGTNDHVAITLRQAGIPCLIAGDEFSQPQNSHPVTLVAGRFNGKEGACILAGDQTAKWLSCRTTLSQDYEPAMNATARYQPVTASFKRPQDGFSWLNQQNDRLLEYFKMDRLFHQCLSAEQSKLLSMSAHRQEIVLQLQGEVDHICEDAAALLSGYKQFLALAGDTRDATVVRNQKDLIAIQERLNSLTVTLKHVVKDIASPLIVDTPASETRAYSGWLAQCLTLKSTLQDLTSPHQGTTLRKMLDLSQPYDTSTINSIHDLVFLIHQRFVNALGPVAEYSGQGKSVEFSFGYEKISKWIEFLGPDDPGLISPDIQAALHHFQFEITVLNLPTAVRLNAALGNHVCELSMFEQAEGGKGRKIKFTFTDYFSWSVARDGKLKRAFFIIGTLLAGGMDRGRMNLDFNVTAERVTMDYGPIGSRTEMQKFYALCATVLSRTFSLDIVLKRDKNLQIWDYESLETRLNQQTWDIESYMGMFLKYASDIHSSSLPVYKILADLHKRFKEPEEKNEPAMLKEGVISAYERCNELGGIREFIAAVKLWLNEYPQIIFPLLETNQFLMALLDPSDIPLQFAGKGEGNNKHHILSALSRGEKGVFKYISERLLNDRQFILSLIKQCPKAMSLDENKDWLDRWRNDRDVMGTAFKLFACCLEEFSPELLTDKQFVLTLYRSRPVSADRFPPALLRDREVVLALLIDKRITLSNVPETLRNDRELVMSAVDADGFNLKFVVDALKNDPEVVLTACKSGGHALEFASNSLKNNKVVVQAAVRKNALALAFTSDSLRNDPEIISVAMQTMNKTGSVYIGGNTSKYFHEAFGYASDQIKTDKRFIIESMTKYNVGRIFSSVDDNLKRDPEVALAALEYWKPPEYCPMQHADPSLLDDPGFVVEAVKRTPVAFKYISDALKSRKSFIKQLLAIDYRIIQYAAEELKQDETLRHNNEQLNILARYGFLTKIHH